MGKFRKKQSHMQKAYEIGYGRPPVTSRWKPGQSGNPGGRPKRATPTLGTMIASTLLERIAVMENGERRSLRKMEVIVQQVVARAVAGKPGAMKDLLALFDLGGDDFLSQAVMQLEPLAYPPVHFNVNFVKSRFKKDDTGNDTVEG